MGRAAAGNAALLYSPGRACRGAATLARLFAPPGLGSAVRGGKAPSPALTAVTGQAGPSTAPAAASRCRRSLHNGISVLVPNAPTRARKQVHKQVLLISPSRETLAPTGMLPPAAVITLPEHTYCEYRSRAGRALTARVSRIHGTQDSTRELSALFCICTAEGFGHWSLPPH